MSANFADLVEGIKREITQINGERKRRKLLVSNMRCEGIAIMEGALDICCFGHVVTAVCLKLCLLKLPPTYKQCSKRARCLQKSDSNHSLGCGQFFWLFYPSFQKPIGDK
eukprot:Seg710.2 transcript_id=Seg710.2/GoldUCD/mRNA.D3Y31 product="hypothetical protein" protein_id=Seg710.2/GoldUCD/D3Y31